MIRYDRHGAEAVLLLQIRDLMDRFVGKVPASDVFYASHSWNRSDAFKELRELKRPAVAAGHVPVGALSDIS